MKRTLIRFDRTALGNHNKLIPEEEKRGNACVTECRECFLHLKEILSYKILYRAYLKHLRRNSCEIGKL